MQTKPDNKTLSQSRSAPPVNLLSSAAAAKSDRLSKELFRGRAGRTGRGRRAAESGGGGELLRQLRLKLAPGLALLAALLAWLLHLVLDVAAMSAELLWSAARSSLQGVWRTAVRWAAAGRRVAASRVAALRVWLARPRRPERTARREGLQENISLPSTGDEALSRLLACRDSDPYR